MGIAVRSALREISALQSERKAEKFRAKTIRIFPCITAVLSRSSKQFSRIRFPSAKTGAALLGKIGVKKAVFESVPESCGP